MEDWWDVVGRNEVFLHVRVVTEEGDGFLGILFSCIKDEAFLYNQAMYQRILALEGSIDAIWPKESEVVRILLAEGWDLLPLIHSYAKYCCEIKTHVILKSIADEKGGAVGVDYAEYLERKMGHEPDIISLWTQKCSMVETQLINTMKEIVEINYPDLMTAEDYRVTQWAMHELMVACSNFAFDLRDNFSELYEGGPVWPE